MSEWETIFGEKPPSGYDFDKADFWPMETWSKLTAEHPKIAYRLGVIFELTRRGMIKRGVDIFCKTPYTWKLRTLTEKELNRELSV